MRIVIEFRDSHLEPLWQILAAKYPPYRMKPKKSWTRKEKIAFVRRMMDKVVTEIVKSDTT